MIQSADDTVVIPLPRLRPPLVADRRDRVRLTRRGRRLAVGTSVAAVAALVASAQSISEGYFSLVVALGGLL